MNNKTRLRAWRHNGATTNTLELKKASNKRESTRIPTSHLVSGTQHSFLRRHRHISHHAPIDPPQSPRYHPGLRVGVMI